MNQGFINSSYLTYFFEGESFVYIILALAFGVGLLIIYLVKSNSNLLFHFFNFIIDLFSFEKKKEKQKIGATIVVLKKPKALKTNREVNIFQLESLIKNTIYFRFWRSNKAVNRADSGYDGGTRIKAFFALIAPTQMRLGETEEVTVKASARVLSIAAKRLRENQQLKEKKFKVTSDVSVDLVGWAFKINPEEGERHRIPKTGETVWNFKIKSIKSGTRMLTAQIYCYIQDAEGKIIKEKTLKKEAEIEVQVKILSDFWDYVLENRVRVSLLFLMAVFFLILALLGLTGTFCEYFPLAC